MSQRTALITGVAGQDGSYMAELLLAKDYKVFGLIRRSGSPGHTARIDHLLDRMELLTGDLTDLSSLQRALLKSKPNEVYNFAAQSFVGGSFTSPLHTADVTGLGALQLFEAVRLYTSVSEHVRVYQASSSEMFGEATTSTQHEATPFDPLSPYACAKTFAHFCAQLYRRSYGMYIACGIAFNHESERRGEEFVTRKITKAVAQVKLGQQDLLRLGNLDARRDWSHAEDIVRGAYQMLQLERPHTLVLASGETHSVQEFVDKAFDRVGLVGSQYVIQDTALRRPADPMFLCGDATKARQVLGWVPQVSFDTLVHRMVDHDLREATEALARDPARAP